MSNEKRLQSPGSHRLALFQEFLKHPRQIGSIISSSRFLERRIVAAAGIDSAEAIVELGPGTGGTTRAILRVMAQGSRILCIEINPHLHDMVSRIKDDRLITHLGDARHLRDILSHYGIEAPDVLISGIPFSTMSLSSGSQILEAIASVLSPGGRFVAYQVSRRVAVLGRPILGPEQMAVGLLNIPPHRIYRWEKNRIGVGTG